MVCPLDNQRQFNPNQVVTDFIGAATLSLRALFSGMFIPRYLLIL